MKKSTILAYVAGYFAIVWYVLALLNAIRGFSINTDFGGFHAIGSIVFFLLSAIFGYVEECAADMKNIR